MTAAGPFFQFKLFVAGNTPNSLQALENLDALCRSRLPGRHQVDVIDVLAEPGQALHDGIFLTPTLVRIRPGPARRLVGTLGDTPMVSRVLELDLELDVDRKAG